MNIIEFMREKSVKSLFLMKSFKGSFPKQKITIGKKLGGNPNFYNFLNLGDSLGEIFKTTGQTGRSQSSVSGGGYIWEGLLCWYLNLCLIGSRTVVIKHRKDLVPKCISDAITVNYGSFTSNTESDLIAITFPNENDFIKDIKDFEDDKGNFDYPKTINPLCEEHFNNLQIGIIQCKTNWNDNAQIPMLWEIVYSSTGFLNRNITIGKNGFTMRDFGKFFYAFVTVPSGGDSYKASGLEVKRVYNLSGGNYWGKPSRSGVAHSIKEIFNKNFSGSWIFGNHKKDFESAIKNKKNWEYFQL